MTKDHKKPSRFPDTRWSLVGRAAGSDDLARQQALAELLVIYTPALRAFLVEGRRVPADLTDDLLHDFILDKILARKLVHHATQGKGKFRNYVLKALNNYVTTKLKREYKIRAMALEIDESTIVDPTSLQIANRFDIEWVQQLVRDTLHLMELDCRERKRVDLWEIFYLRVVDPMLNDTEPADYEQLVKRFNIQTPRQAMNLLGTAKRCFNRHLRVAVGRYVSDENRIDEEIVDLREILGR